MTKQNKNASETPRFTLACISRRWLRSLPVEIVSSWKLGRITRLAFAPPSRRSPG